MADKAPDTTSENAVGWMILGVVFVAIGWLAWHFLEYQIKDGVRWVRYGEMKLITTFTDSDYNFRFVDDFGDVKVLNYDRFVNETVPRIPASCDRYRTDRERETLGWCLNSQTMRLLSKAAMEPVRIPIILILGLFGLWAYMYGPKSYFRRKLSIDGLIGQQSRNFPVISPFLKFNPSNQPPRPPGSPVPAELPLFAEALGPEEWVAYNNVPVPDGKLDEQAAQIAFSKQLGPPWRGAARLEPYKQVLLAAFCLKASRKRSEADEMLGELALCWSEKGSIRVSPKLLRRARGILKDKNLAASTLALCNQHAFQTTALLRALSHAREEGGVLAPAQFVWLRGYDRHLWYPLNNLGRQAYHMEALGAMSHFKAEKLTQRPIPKPKVEDAVRSIRDYMSSQRARPIPQLDYSAGGKRAIKKPKSAGVKKPAAKAGKPGKAGA